MKRTLTLLCWCLVAQLVLTSGFAAPQALAAGPSNGGLWQNLVGFVRSLVEERATAKLGADGGDAGDVDGPSDTDAPDGVDCAPDGLCPDGGDVGDADVTDGDDPLDDFLALSQLIVGLLVAILIALLGGA